MEKSLKNTGIFENIIFLKRRCLKTSSRNFTLFHISLKIEYPSHNVQYLSSQKFASCSNLLLSKVMAKDVRHLMNDSWLILFVLCG